MLVTKSSIIEKSDRKFEIPDAADDTNKNEKTSLNQLSGMPPFTKVTCEVKILRVDDVTETVNGKKLQNVLVADSTGMAKVTLWENDVNRLKVLKSYRLTKMLVREFRGQVQLSATKEDTQMVEIDDLASVKEDDDLLLNSTLTNAKIVGVSSLEKYLSCLKCSGKVNTDGEYGSCNKCGMFQCLDACKEEATAQLMVRSSTGNLMFKAFGKVLQQIAGEEVTAITLLQAQPFTAFHQDGIINSISRSSTTGLNKVEK